MKHQTQQMTTLQDTATNELTYLMDLKDVPLEVLIRQFSLTKKQRQMFSVKMGMLCCRVKEGLSQVS